MDIKRIISAAMVIVGIAFFVFGSYIAGEVAQGQKKISSAQKSVDQGRSLTDRSPYTKGIGGMATESVQKKIDAGKQDAAKYQMIANWLHGSGVVLFVGGIGLFVFTLRTKKRR